MCIAESGGHLAVGGPNTLESRCLSTANVIIGLVIVDIVDIC